MHDASTHDTRALDARAEYQRFHAARRRMLRKLLTRHAPTVLARGLDIGGGADVNEWAPLLRAQFNTELHAVDMAEDVERGKAAGLLSVACNVDSEPLPYAEAFFDLVVFASVLEHLYNPRHAIDEIARVLKPGGLLLLEAPNAVALGRRLDALIGRNPFAYFNRYNALEGKAFMEYCAVFYTPEEAKSLLAPHFDILECRFAMHAPRANPAKAFLRSAAAHLRPRLSDCFAIAARKRNATRA